MRVLGVDPGLAKLGWGVVEKKGNHLGLIAYGCIRTSSQKNIAERLGLIYQKLTEIITEFQPEALAVEQLFFNRNITSALLVAQGRGVVILTGYQKNLDLYEYTPLQIKQALVGYGRAEKQQVQNMVKVLLNLKAIPRPFDSADALGAAICHLQSVRLNSYIKKKQV